MNAIVPLNIAALRVNNNDSTNVVKQFQGKTATFESMPWNNPQDQKPPKAASTGDKIYNPLAVVNGNPEVSPKYPLGLGVHLQWELPDYFRKGTQPAEGGNLTFPHAPNRWLIIRHLSFYDPGTKAYQPSTSKSWIVESDYLFGALSPDKYGIIRPAISVPIPYQPGFQEQPYMYMGRVVDYADWNPSSESPSNYLPAHNGTDGYPLYLTSIGFVGSYFGSYYPECCSVYGFWDHFADVPYDGGTLYNAIQNNTPVQFRTSYQVIGWLNEPNEDPLADIVQEVTDQYNAYLDRCNKNNVAPDLTPKDFFDQVATEELRWSFNLNDVSYTLNANHTIASLELPTQSLCGGTAQEVVWNMGSNTGTTYFLKSNSQNPAVWDAPVELAVGNSTEEALAALLKYEMGAQTDDQDVLSNYELLLDALQLGLLSEIEKNQNKLIALEEALHSNGFATTGSNHLWVVTQNTEYDQNKPVQPNTEVNLPLDLAEQLYLLNKAQKAYDQGRAALSTMRRQLFMDWTHYVKMYTGEITDPNINEDPNTAINIISKFLSESGGGELNAVIDEGKSTGIILYKTDARSGTITGIQQPKPSVSTTSLAYALWENYNTVLNALKPYKEWTLQNSNAPAFFQPEEPVLLMEGPMMEPVARNGTSKLTFVRLSMEILSTLSIESAGSTFKVDVSKLSNVPIISSQTPMQADVQALVGEAYLITPMLAVVVANALAAAGGTGNPAVTSLSDFVTSLMYAQGGLSPLDVAPNPGGVSAPPKTSLFATVNDEAYIPAANAVIDVASPQALKFTFTNSNTNGWPPNAISWTTQEALPAFSSTRVDPFLPIFMIWNVSLRPLKWENQDTNGNPVYKPTNLTDFFTLDEDAVDYMYKMQGGSAVPFTSPDAVGYGNSATMSSNSTGVLVYQINSFIADHPNDPEKDILQQIAKLYDTKRFLSQAVSGFNQRQILTSFVAQVAVEDLVKGSRDSITTQVAQAAVATEDDNWYNFAFNSIEPISTGLMAQGNFGPLRSGFMEIQSIELVDAFGQRMDLDTASHNPDGSLACVTAITMTPPEADTANKGQIYLPPRLLQPTRLWYQWLSANHNTNVPGVNEDFVEMNTHPATSPICGWVLPNHLDDNLFFYDADGTAIGIFGIEHRGTNPTLKYRTRAGNLKNPSNLLQNDIGAENGPPTVNPFLAHYMWYINGQSADFLTDLMSSIEKSDVFIDPANFAQDASLSVLIGRPLALTRAVIGMETAGNLLPLSQADNTPSSPFPQDVNAGRYKYADRMEYSSADLGKVQFPLRLGDLANLDDGLVGYLIENTNSNPYSGAIFYAPAATSAMKGNVRKPQDTTIQLTLNAPVMSITMLVDPRAAVHATTGVLPVNSLSIPPDQYSAILNSLSVNFISRPVLSERSGLVLPLPSESGYAWSWITPGADATTPLQADAGSSVPAYGYTPQTVLEGWLELSPDPDSEGLRDLQRNTDDSDQE